MHPRPAVVTIGSFDGVHRGHQRLIGQVVARARALGLRSCVVTFDPHPREVLRPEQPLLRLTSTAHKARKIRALGVDDVWVCPFTRELARLGPAEFIALVSQRWPIQELWVGHDFALGRDRAGSIQALATLGAEQGWRLHVVPPLLIDGQPVSSSRIRALLAQGQAEEARRLLAA